ncbi:hypothetical protein PALB_35940 [Pseudoalteromonas luteoviolacea B = ATCC 29581]|nr:hypothetical protein PALB_35940 [Pseudoalteromonas luteoviolacea B = ATCC 29581]
MRPFFGLMLLACLSAGAFSLIESISTYNAIIICLLTVLYFSSRHDVDLGDLILFILVITIFERVLVGPIYYLMNNNIVSNFTVNTLFFSSHLATDLLLVFICRNRWTLTLKKSQILSNEDFKRSKGPSLADAPTMGLFLLFVIFDLMLLGENTLRNLEQFGVSEEFAKQFWGAQFFYNIHAETKSVLQAILFMLLTACVVISRSKTNSRKMFEKA